MAQEYFGVKFENEVGDIHVNRSVFEWITRITVQEVSGAHIVDSSFKKGISAVLSKNGLLKIEIDVKYNYGLNAERTSRLIQDKVMDAIKQMVDVHPDQVDVNVLGFQFDK